MTIAAPSAGIKIRPNRSAAGVRRQYPSNSAARRVRSGVGVGTAGRSVAGRRKPKRVGIRYAIAGCAGFGLATAVLVLPSIAAQAGRTVTETSAQSVVTVNAGESLWSVATREYPGMDPREAIAELRVANGLTRTDLVPGQVLVLPGR